MPPDQQPVGVDAVGRAGHQGTVVLPRLHAEGRKVGRLDDQDLVALVSVCAVEDRQRPYIPLDDLVEIREEAGARQAAVTGQNAVGRLAPYGETAARDVADGDLKDGLVHPVVNRQLDADLRYVDVPHDAGGVDGQFPGIGPKLLFTGVPHGTRLGKAPVVLLGGAYDPVIVFPAHTGDGRRVCPNCPRLMERVPPVRKCRIGNKTEAGEDDAGQY